MILFCQRYTTDLSPLATQFSVCLNKQWKAVLEELLLKKGQCQNQFSYWSYRECAPTLFLGIAQFLGAMIKLCNCLLSMNKLLLFWLNTVSSFGKFTQNGLSYPGQPQLHCFRCWLFIPTKINFLTKTT